MSPLPSQRGTATTQHAGLQPGQPVATAWTAEQDQELVVNEFAASADKDRRSARQARPLLLVALGRRASEPEAVRRDAEEDLGAACAGRLTRERRAAGAGSCREARSEWCRQRGRPALPEHLDRTRSEGRTGEDKRIERKQCEERAPQPWIAYTVRAEKAKTEILVQHQSRRYPEYQITDSPPRGMPLGEEPGAISGRISILRVTQPSGKAIW